MMNRYQELVAAKYAEVYIQRAVADLRAALSKYSAQASPTVSVVMEKLQPQLDQLERDARQTLVTRRDTLLSQLEQLESKRRAGTVDPNNYSTRRQRIYTELERIYGELDEVGAGPEGGGEGIAA